MPDYLPLIITPSISQEGARYLQQVDPILAPIIQAAGLCTITPHTNYYEELVSAIISQQLSVKAARTIEYRFKQVFGDAIPTPTQILHTPIEILRSAGLSTQKSTYIRDLASHILQKTITFSYFDTLANETIIKELTAVKGIAIWTAQMFLMFCLGRSDILATSDLGIQTGVKKLYHPEGVASEQQVIKIAQQYMWHPYETLACWYIWFTLDNAPVNI